MSVSQNFLLLDRDGVINEERKNYVLNWDQFIFKTDFIENVRVLSDYFQKILVVTNQSCVGKGLITKIELENIHKK